MDTLKESYEWVRIPVNLPRSNLVMITAKTTRPTIHPEDPDYPIRIFRPTELAEAGRSLAQRAVGCNHQFLIENGFTVDSNWNPDTESVEALLFLPDFWMNKIRTNRIKKVSVEYTWRDEVKTEKGTEFIGLVFNRVDLLEFQNPGDKSIPDIKLVESEKRGLFEGELIQASIDEAIEEPNSAVFKSLDEAADNAMKTLGEPFAGFKDFGHCKIWARQHGKSNPDAYCGYIKHQVEDPKKEVSIPMQDVETATYLVDDKRTATMGQAALSVPETNSDFSKSVNGEPPKGGDTKMETEKDKTLTESAGGQQTTSAPPTNTTQAPATVVPPATAGAAVVEGAGKPTEAVVPPAVVVPPPVITPPPVVVPPPVDPMTLPEFKVLADRCKLLESENVKMKEVEKAVVKMQETIKTADAVKADAVKKAAESARKEILDKVESVLPDQSKTSSWNRGGQMLATELRRVLYEAKEK